MKEGACDVRGVGVGVFRNLFVNGEEGRRVFPLYVTVATKDDKIIGTFASNPIKVISKPSKKKQTTKGQELCILSGTPISLFNRHRSQTNTTRYLGVSPTGTALAPLDTTWTSFLIWCLDDPRFDEECVPGLAPGLKGGKEVKLGGGVGVWKVPVCAVEEEGREREGSEVTTTGTGTGSVASPQQAGAPGHGPVGSSTSGAGEDEAGARMPPGAGRVVRYDDVVVLQHVGTGLITVPLVVRKIEGRTKAVGGKERCGGEDAGGGGALGTDNTSFPDAADLLDSLTRAPDIGDPISELHKVALQLRGDPTSWLAQDNDTIFIHRTPLASSSGRKSRKGKSKSRSASSRDDYEDDDAWDTNYTPSSNRRRTGGPSSSYSSSKPSSHRTKPTEVGEKCIWTITSTTQSETTFHIPPSPPTPSFASPPSFFPLHAPHPTLTHATFFPPHTVTLHGHDLSEDVTVFFGGARCARVEVRCRQVVVVEVPEAVRGTGNDNNSNSSNSNGAAETAGDGGGVVPVLLVRRDGVVYRTGVYWRV
ncbi:hypothetical protein HK104_003817 [Borealophlyctis nickersoniae]|nr:hypothetical protein HK104_003817 [Borealophlyctis nickersoniae]